jgi:hypothetical protein
VDRLEVIATAVDLMEGTLRFEIDYTVRETNSRYNFVWDYYATEGAGGRP